MYELPILGFPELKVLASNIDNIKPKSKVPIPIPKVFNFVTSLKYY
jgi:hypothetical protein